MTNSNGNKGDRLDRIEALVAENSRAIAENRQAIAETRQAIAEQRESIAQLAQAAQAALSIAQNSRESLQQTDQLTRRNAAAIARLDEKMEQYIAEGKEHREFIAAQVDGIKVETRRIVEYLFSERNNE
ncbi:MAG: hypothetical protein AAFQ80_10505 [Cyanobacteria bacterium J06621_8]